MCGDVEFSAEQNKNDASFPNAETGPEMCFLFVSFDVSLLIPSAKSFDFVSGILTIQWNANCSPGVMLDEIMYMDVCMYARMHACM